MSANANVVQLLATDPVDVGAVVMQAATLALQRAYPHVAHGANMQKLEATGIAMWIVVGTRVDPRFAELVEYAKDEIERQLQQHGI